MDEAELFSAPLRSDYREPLRHGRFVGRSRELERLEEILTNRESSTVLLAGYRGTGKTALVDEALRRAKNADRQVVVRIAPPHLDQDLRPSAIRSQLLRSMARGLYFESLDLPGLSKKLRERISETYKKTCLKELESHHGVETATTSSRQERSSNVSQTSINMSTTVRLLAGGLTAALIGTLGIGSATVVSEWLGTGWAIASFASILTMATIAGITLKRTKEEETSFVEGLTERGHDTEIGKFDLSDAALEHELSQSLRRLADEKHRVVFVFDELDKLGDNGKTPESIEATPTFAILTCLKNFFSLGNAIYVFITDDQFFENLSLEQRGTGYGLSHTIFTDRLYVGPLHYSDVETLIDQSLEKRPKAENYDRFQNYVCWESSNHAFDTLQVLDSFVENRNGTPTLRPVPTGEFSGVWQEGNLPSNWSTKAALQKHVGVAYDEARRSGRGEELYNQALWESLRESAAILLGDEPVQVIGESVYRVPGRFFKSLPPDDQESVSGAVQRMLIRMERHGTAIERITAFDADHAAFDDYEPGEIDEIQVYWIAPAAIYPPSTIASESVLLPAEETLIEACKRLGAIVAAVEGIVSLSEEQLQVRDSLKSICDRLQESGPRKTQKRSAVYSAIPQAAALAESLIEQVLNVAIQTWSDEQSYTSGTGLDANAPHSGYSWRDELASDFEPLIEALDGEEVSPVIIGGDANANAIAVLTLIDDEKLAVIQDSYSRCLTRNEKTREERRHRLPIVHIGIGTDREAQLPTEMIEVMSEVRPFGWFMQFLGIASSAAKRVPTDLVGWTHFDLDGDLGNLADLAEELSRVSFVRTQDV
ncbi:ATP-binding protein [Candidatus Poriferisodalis sp.]|uniref:ATP-binding protein n=1 Tax=Candidatus Poriferisodalis sp. TaxID=3101277 RepID=UPI003B598BCC